MPYPCCCSPQNITFTTCAEFMSWLLGFSSLSISSITSVGDGNGGCEDDDCPSLSGSYVLGFDFTDTNRVVFTYEFPAPVVICSSNVVRIQGQIQCFDPLGAIDRITMNVGYDKDFGTGWTLSSFSYLGEGGEFTSSGFLAMVLAATAGGALSCGSSTDMPWALS